jgi:hypothetical protein
VKFAELGDQTMKQYMLSVHNVQGAPVPSAEVMQQMFSDVDAFNQSLKTKNAWVFACGLHPADTATVVRHQGPEVLVTDGPFAESKEHLGGFWVIKCEDMDAALDLAKQASRACQNPVEVRPLQDDSTD